MKIAATMTDLFGSINQHQLFLQDEKWSSKFERSNGSYKMNEITLQRETFVQIHQFKLWYESNIAIQFMISSCSCRKMLSASIFCKKDGKRDAFIACTTHHLRFSPEHKRADARKDARRGVGIMSTSQLHVTYCLQQCRFLPHTLHFTYMVLIMMQRSDDLFTYILILGDVNCCFFKKRRTRLVI